MIYGSVCSGIEAATVAWHPLGWRPAFFSEIERFPRSVLAHHYPDVPLHGDFTTIKEAEYGPIDVLVGGTPCQAFSIAGLRKGLADERGNLTLEFIRLVQRLRPRWVVWENVPGVLSIDGGNAIRSFLDALEELGYIVDIDILDAQFFGVPQRRRRVFVCGQSVEDILNQKTSSSSLTIAQCLVEILHGILIETFSPSEKERVKSERASLSEDGLKRKIKLFGLSGEKNNWPMLRENLIGAYQRFQQDQKSLELKDGASEKERIADGLLTGFLMDSRFILTEESLKKGLEDASSLVKLYTTSTLTNRITPQVIFMCSKAVLNIGKLILLLRRSSPCSSQAELSFLTALMEFTNYARQADGDLFSQLSGVCAWGDFLREAEGLNKIIRHFGYGEFGQEIFSVSESLRGDITPSRETRQEVAGAITASSFTGGAGGKPEGAAQNHFIGSHWDGDFPHPTLGRGGEGGIASSNQEIFSQRGAGLDKARSWPAEIAPTLNAAFGQKLGLENQHINEGGGYLSLAKCLTGTMQRLDAETETLIPCQGGFFDKQITHIDGGETSRTLSARYDGSVTPDRGPDVIAIQAVAIPINTQISMRHEALGEGTGMGIGAAGDPAFTLQAAHHHAVAFAQNQSGEVFNTINTNSNASGRNTPMMLHRMQVRRLTPTECERLMGFPDGYTKLTAKTPDGPRYKALGNSMAVPVMAWLGQRIQMV